MGFSRPDFVLYGETYDAMRQRVRDEVDHSHDGPTSSLDEARAERETDYAPVPWWECEASEGAEPSSPSSRKAPLTGRVGPSPAGTGGPRPQGPSASHSHHGTKAA